MDVDKLDLNQLVELLDDLEHKRTPVGWTPDDAVIKSGVERRIMELVMGRADDERRRNMRVPCDMRIVLRTKERSMPTTVINIGEGGAFVQGATELPNGTHVHLQIKGGLDEHGLHVRGQVAWRQTEPVKGVGVSFEHQPSAAHERRLRRFVLELLRHRAE